MKLLLAALAFTGCSAAQSAVGLLTPKPTAQVTVVANVPAVAVAAPEAHHGRVAAAVGGGVAGAVVGGVAGAVLSSGAPTIISPLLSAGTLIAGAALVGAGVGTVIALAVHDVAD